MLWVFDRSRQVEVPIPPDLSGADPEIASFIRQRAALVESHRVDAAAWAALGMAYEANGFDAASKRCYEQAVAIKPDEAKWWYRLAITQARSGDVASALDTEQHVLNLDPRYGPAFWRRGMWLIDRGDFDAAGQAFQRAVDLAGGDPAGWLGLARVSLHRHDPHRAIDLIQRFLSAHRPSDASVRRYAYQLLGAAYRQLGRADEASRALGAAPANEPNWRDPWTDELVYFRKGAAALAREAAERLLAGQVETAVALFERLQKENPTDLALLNRLAAVYGSAGRVEDSLRLLHSAAEQNPAYYDTQANLAAAYLARNELPAALEHVNRAIVLNPQVAKAHETKGMILWRAGRSGEAVDEFDAAIRCDPRSVKSLLAIGAIDGEARRWDRALSRFRQAAAIDPLEIDAFVGLGVAAMHVGALDESEKALEHAADLDPQDARLREAQAELRNRRESGAVRGVDRRKRPAA